MNCGMLAYVYLLILLVLLSYLVAYRVYNYSVFSATLVGEGPSADGSFLTREDGEFINTTIMSTSKH